MKTAFNAVSKVKDWTGTILTGKGWAIFSFLFFCAAASTAAAANPAALGFFEGTIKAFLTPVFEASTYTEGVPAIITQLSNTGSAAFDFVTGATSNLTVS